MTDPSITIAPGSPVEGASTTMAAQRAETNLRVRNMLAIIRSVFERTAATGTSLEEVAQHFTGRRDAIARRQSWAAVGQASVEIEDVIRDELLTVSATEGPKLTIEGPPTLLAQRQAELVGLAIHELVTNSIKFGALGGEGAMAIEWSVVEGPTRSVALRWTETGIAIVAPAPMRIGFGREFIEQALPYQLHAITQFNFEPGKLCCMIVFPVEVIVM